MLEINIHQIPEAGMDIDTSLPADLLEINEPGRVTDLTPIICELKATMLDNDLIVRGDLTVIAQCKCDRCLEDIELDIHSDDICIIVENCPEKVDLTNDIREDILLAFPQTYLCNEDCKGLCFQCGTNLNKEECQCGDTDESESPWNALDNLNFDDEK